MVVVADNGLGALQNVGAPDPLVRNKRISSTFNNGNKVIPPRPTVTLTMKKCSTEGLTIGGKVKMKEEPKCHGSTSCYSTRSPQRRLH